ncbi:beta-defensin 107-like [Saccopteryx leptura]|uniref:beta-defensin 107-like n=1 Tax=Saccopteryx leptura TaxID=249018 RepID=UPI00339C53DC
MPGAMRIFVFTAAALILLALTFSARAGVHRQLLCKKMHGRCEASCLTFEDKLGGCRADLTPFCCRKRQNN